MARTVSNHSKVVCNIGSNHTAFTDADPCKLPKVDKYDNAAYSANLQAGRSTKTTISKHPIALRDTHWTPSVSPGMEGTSAPGSPTFMEAWVIVGSPDLIIEGKPAGRCYDKTKQNKGNSEGEVKPGKIEPRNDGQTERAKKKCTLHKWGAEARGGALLGWRAGAKTATPNYLDVWDSDTLDFWAIRHDISRTPPREGVQCEVPVKAVVMHDGKKFEVNDYHTIWDATATVFPSFGRKETLHEAGKDKFSFPANMALEKWLSGSVMKALADGNPKDAAKALIGQMASKWMTNDGSDRMEDFDPSDPSTAGRFRQGQGEGLGRQNYGGINDPTKASGLIRNPDQKLARLPDTAQGAPLKPAWEVQDDQRRLKEKKPKSIGFKVEDVRTLIFYAAWMLFPPEIKVTAQACSGQREATIRVLPNQRLEFGVTLPLGEKFKSWADKKKRDKQKASKEADDAVKQATEEAQAAEQAKNAAKAAENQARTQQAAALDRLQAAGDKKRSIPGDTGAAQRGRARQERKMDRAYDQWKKSGAEAHKQLGEYRATMAKYETAAEHLNKCITAAANMKKGLNVCQKLANVARQPLVFKFLENLEIKVIVEYLRTPEGWGGQRWNYYTNAMMGRKWTFKFSTSPLLKIDWTIYFSLLNLVAGYLPGVVSFLRWIGVRVDLYFRIAFNIPVSLNVKKSQNDKFSGGVEVGVKATPELGVIVGTGIDVVQVSASVPTEIKAEFSAPKTKGSLATVTPKFFITNHVRVVFFPQRRWSVEAISETFSGLTYTFNQDSRYKYQFGSLPS